MSERTISPRLYVAVFAALATLTLVTTGVAYIDLGVFNAVAALSIAVVKAALVVLFFMHLAFDRPFNAIVFIASLCFVMLFVILALVDTSHYQDTLIPGYAPDMPSR